MQNSLSAEDLYINDFHRRNSMAAQREVMQMSLHPCSREQKIEQIQMLKRLSASSKESANGRSSESHQARLNGRVVTDVDIVNAERGKKQP